MSLDGQTEGGISYLSAASADAWRCSGAARAEFLLPLTERMLDLAGLRTGSRVLDVGAGTGEQTLVAAARVGTSGSVLAIDVSAPMLAVAADAARAAGLSNIETRVMDARRIEELESGSFDATISRNALMLVPEAERVLASVRKVLKPASKFAAIIFSTAENNPAVSLPRAAVRRYAGLPPVDPEEPGIFRLGHLGVLAAMLEEAGFIQVSVEIAPVERPFPSVAAAVEFFCNANPDVSELLNAMNNAQRDSALDEITDIMRRFVRNGEVLQPAEYLICAGLRPADGPSVGLNS